MRTRRNVWKLPAGDDTLTWYGRAVTAMKAKPIGDPTSWRYQAAIHDYIRANDPLSEPGDVLPSTSEQRDFWVQCQHGSWFFLPWHRMYLLHFEAIVGAAIESLGGPKDWALPYWNYSEDLPFRILPPAFRGAKLGDGTPNPLFVAERSSPCNKGKQFTDDLDVDLTNCLAADEFESGPFGAAPGFGGPVTLFEHGGGAAGTLENTPHGAMHVRVGGSTGWMSAFETAALDPIFWLHHANIDRLWEVWLKRNAAHQNPSTNNWLKNVSFKFHDASVKVVTMTADEVRDTTSSLLSYVYEETGDPLAGGPEAVAAVEGLELPMRTKPIPELIGATRTEFDLDAATTHTSLAVRAPTGPAALGVTEGPARKRRWILNIENITSDGRAPSYDVFLNVPASANPTDHPELHAGRMPMFGLVETSRRGLRHAGSGLHYAFEITGLVDRLSRAPGWDPSNLRVSFVPVGEATGSKVNVGRVSIYSQ